MSGAGTEPALKHGEETLVVKIKDVMTGTEMFYSIKPETPLWKLMHVYSHDRSFQLYKLRYIFGRRRIGYDHTPLELGMEDGAEISTYLRVCGC